MEVLELVERLPKLRFVDTRYMNVYSGDDVAERAKVSVGGLEGEVFVKGVYEERTPGSQSEHYLIFRGVGLSLNGLFAELLSTITSYEPIEGGPLVANSKFPPSEYLEDY